MTIAYLQLPKIDLNDWHLKKEGNEQKTMESRHPNYFFFQGNNLDPTV